MNLTIIPIDGAVYIDGYSFAGLDLSTCNIPNDVHALQWSNDNGWIEFKLNNEHHPANETITELPQWANNCVTKWNEAKTQQITNNQPISNGTQPA